ncbi:DNA cytosine methyltransferase, partial [Romboutsia sp.]|uniref:DNA cytosine methyltransferase n=1 Tax=Romboutsia sp. TaxID=1965302 RepID=UPI002BFBCE75
MEKGINVLSLCDGMSCGQIALERAGIKVNNYFASEIENSSIKITQKNYPNTIQLGDMTKINEAELDKLPRIDLVISGTPCRDFSKCTIQGGSNNWENMHSIGKGVYGKHSSLFFIFKEIYDYIKANNNQNVKFLFENVVMKKNDEEVVNSVLGLEPVKINSSIFSAQNRERLYWTDINIAELPKESNLVLKDIILSDEKVDEKFWYNDRGFEFQGEDKRVACTLIMKGHDIQKRVSSKKFKCPTLTSCRGGNLQKKVYQNGRCRKLTPTEYEILQTVPVGYTKGVSDSQRYNMLGDGWTVDAIAHIFKG